MLTNEDIKALDWEKTGGTDSGRRAGRLLGPGAHARLHEPRGA